MTGSVAGCDQPVSPAAELHARAGVLLDIGEHEAALEALRAALAADPLHAPSHVLAGRIAEASGDAEGALAAYWRAARSDEAHAPAYYHLGRMMLASGNVGEALRFAGAARRLAPRDPRVLALVSLVALRAGNLDGALAAASAAVEAGPSDPAARLALASVRQAAEGPDAALEALVAPPQVPDPGVRAMALGLFDALGRPAEAITFLKDEATVAPADPALRLMLARRSLAAGLPEAARVEYRAAARLAPADREAVSALARLAFAEGGVAGALDELDRLARVAPDPLATAVREIAAAEVEALSGDAAAAAARLDRLWRSAGSSAGKGLAAVEMARIAAAERDAALAERALALVPAEAGAEMVQVAEHAVAAGAAEAAARTLAAQRAAAGGAAEPALLVALGRAQAAIGETLMAAASLAAATESAAPGGERGARVQDVAPWLARAEFEHRAGRSDLAAGTLEAGLSVAPGHPALLGALAVLLDAEGEREGAFRIVEALIGKGEGGAWADRSGGAPAEAAAGTLRRLADSAATPEALAPVAAAAAAAAARWPGASAFAILAAETEARLGRADEAILALRRLAAVRPGDEAVHVALMRHLVLADRAEEGLAAATLGLATASTTLALRQGRAVLLERLDRPEEALAEYAELYRADPVSVVNANNLASLLAELRPDPDSIERAAAIARRFARATDPHLQDTYGWTLFLSGRTDEALPVLRAAAAALPSNPVVQYHLARAYAAAGRGEEARATLRMALSLDFRQNFRYLPLIEEALALYVLHEE